MKKLDSRLSQARFEKSTCTNRIASHSITKQLNTKTLSLSLSALLLGTGMAFAQVDDLEEDIYILDPFEVTTDIDGYKALDTLGGARVRTTLADTASSLSVITPKLMQDLNVTDAESLLIYTTNTEVSGLGGNFSGMPTRGFGVSNAGEDTRLINPAGTNRSRGLAPMDNTRNYFRSEIPWDGFNLSRIDISRGPNSFLFGVGSPSGISNISTNDAAFKDFGNVELHYGSYGTTRESLDYNKEIIENELAARIDLVNEQKEYKQQPAYNHSKRAYMALRYDPSFLDTDSSHTKIMFNYEHGNVNSNNPRTLPPMDYITGYFDKDIVKSGYDPFIYHSDASDSDPNASPWTANEDHHYAFGNMPTYWYDSVMGKLIKAAQSNAGDTTASVHGFHNATANDASAYNIYTSGFRHYAEAVNYRNSKLFPGADAGTIKYLDKTLSDSSIFDFYKKLIDGDNKHEWQDWDAYNISLVQSLFNDRLVLQAIATKEKYERGMEGILSGYVSPYISVDLNSYNPLYPTWIEGNLATKNENIGRPFIAGQFGGGNNSSRFVHKNYQLTASYSLRADDFTQNSSLIKILGHHDITGLIGKYVTEREDRQWVMYSADESFSKMRNVEHTLAYRTLSWVNYLGDSLLSANSASGTHLDNISSKISPSSGPVVMFDKTWIAEGVDPAAPWINHFPNGDNTMTQADNPANYAGYKPYNLKVLNSRDNINQLYSSGNKSKETLESYAIMYQGHLWDDAIIPSFGWRRDKVRQQGTSAPEDDTTAVALMDYEIDDPGVKISTTSVSYGVAVHLGKIFKNILPENDDISLYYFHGNNQTPKVRHAIDATILPNEEGETDDISIQYDGFNGRFTARLTYFKTVDKYAPASYGQPLGNKGYLIDSLPSWTIGFAIPAIIGVEYEDKDIPDSLLNLGWLWSWGRSHTDKVNELKEAIQNEYSDFFNQNFWDMYGLPVDVAAIKAGDWFHVLKTGKMPSPYNINNSNRIHGKYAVIDQDLESKGFELEATVRPLPNWDITFNASRVEATQTKLGDQASAYLKQLAEFYVQSPLADMPMWGDYNSPVSRTFLSDLWGPYLTQVALTGSDQPELRKWNFRVISNYTFDTGALKGFNIGGAYRWSDSPILGYGIKKGVMFGKDAWIYDVEKPFYGSTDSHFDCWIGYQRELTEKIDWRIQINLRNVGESSDLETIALQPDGSVAQQRITEGMTYDLSMKFMF